MPELPEVEITARLIAAATSGAEIESVLAPGLNAVKTFDPPLQALTGPRFSGIRRRGKLFLIDLRRRWSSGTGGWRGRWWSTSCQPAACSCSTSGRH